MIFTLSFSDLLDKNPYKANVYLYMIIKRLRVRTYGTLISGRIGYAIRFLLKFYGFVKEKWK
jgi:hypothetical protein